MADSTRNPTFSIPDRIAVDAQGFGWRVWDYVDHWSMVPTNPDNEPIPEPLTWFVRLPDPEFVASVVERLDMLTMGEPSTISEAADILRGLLGSGSTQLRSCHE